MTLKVLIIEDSWRDLANFLAEPLWCFRDKRLGAYCANHFEGSAAERQANAFRECAQNALDAEFFWLAEVEPTDAQVAQGQVEEMRSLLQALRENNPDSFITDPEAAERIGKLLGNRSNVLVADEGLLEPVNPNFPYELQFTDPTKIYLRIRELVRGQEWDLIVADRRVPRIADADHRQIARGCPPDLQAAIGRKQTCNWLEGRRFGGVDLVQDYLAHGNHPAVFVVVSVEAYRTFMIDRHIYRLPDDDANLYCDKNSQGFNENFLDALEYALSRRNDIETFIGRYAQRVFEQFQEQIPQLVNAPSHRVARPPLTNLIDNRGAFAKLIKRRVILAVFVEAVCHGLPPMCHDLRARLGRLCGILDNFGVELDRCGFSGADDIRKMGSVSPAEAEWLIQLFGNRLLDEYSRLLQARARGDD